MPIIFLLFTLFPAVTAAACGRDSLHCRRLLHQPFFPVIDASPPAQAPSGSQSQSPSPQPQIGQHHQRQTQLPKYPFSTTPPNTPEKPFFPSYQPTPPSPPPPSILSTLPANISSLLFPRRPPSAASAHRHLLLLSVSLSLLFAAVLAAILALLLYFRRRGGGPSSGKTSSRSDSQRLFPPNLPPSDATHKTSSAAAAAQRSSSTTPTTSREFLYLGTLVNPDSSQQTPPPTNVGIRIGVATSPTAYHKLGSPELKPLPPLPKQNNSTFTSGEMCFSKEEAKFETSEEDEDDDDEEEEFFSPRGSSGRKEILNPDPNPNPTRIGSSSRRENFGSRSFNSRTASYPYTNSNSPSNSITSSCQSPVPNLSPKSISPDGVLGFSNRNSQFVSIKLPPPPPPPPPPRFWEAPGVVKGFPVLVPPSKSVVVKNIGPEETTLKPKLKPLHWDKVRASSDRAMVWDQLKSSSFQ